MLVTRDDLVRKALFAGQKIIVILVGTMGSGKTTIARALERIGFRSFSFEAMFAEQVWAAASNPALLDETLTEPLLFEAIRGATERGINIVVDIPNIRRQDRDELRRMALLAGYSVVLVHMNTDLATCKARVAVRDPFDPDSELVDELYLLLAMPANAPHPSEGTWLVLTPTEFPDVYELTYL